MTRYLLYSVFPLLLATQLCAVRVLIFDAGFAKSITLMSLRMAESLVAQNHSVAVWSVREVENEPQKVPRGVTLIDVPYDYGPAWRNMIQHWAFGQVDSELMQEVGEVFSDCATRTCEYQLENFEAIRKRLVKQMGSTPFDLAIYHIYGLCSAMLSEKLDIPKHTFVATDTVVPQPPTYFHGLPSNPSYIPATGSASSDHMAFFDRLQNAQTELQLFMTYLWPVIRWEAQVWQKLALGNMGFFDTVSETTEGLLINGESLLDFPRPLPIASLFMGNLQAKPDEDKQENKKMDVFYEEKCAMSNKGVIVVSFGSMVNASQMPLNLRTALLNGLAPFTEYTVFWRFTAPLPEAAKYKHINIVKWLPQRQLLRHRRTKLFVTHGGYNSLLESSSAGVPMVFVPLFLDQMGNAMRAMRLGLGVALDKSHLNSQSLTAAIKRVLSDQTFADRAAKLATIFDDKIVPPEVLLSHTIKLLAKRNSKRPQLQSRNLNFIRHQSLDILAVFVLIFIFGQP